MLKIRSPFNENSDGGAIYKLDGVVAYGVWE